MFLVSVLTWIDMINVRKIYTFFSINTILLFITLCKDRDWVAIDLRYTMAKILDVNSLLLLTKTVFNQLPTAYCHFYYVFVMCANMTKEDVMVKKTMYLKKGYCHVGDHSRFLLTNID